VLWFEIIEGDESAVQRLWLAPLADDPQDRRDGFGLGVIHPWSPIRQN
jgi:hypothetical protein